MLYFRGQIRWWSPVSGMYEEEWFNFRLWSNKTGACTPMLVQAFPPPHPKADMDQDKSSALGRKHFCITASLAVLLFLHIAVDLATSRHSLIHYVKSKIRDGSQVPNATSGPCLCETDEATRSPTEPIMDRTKMKDILNAVSHDMAYVYSIDTLFTTMAKAGSSTTWRMMFLGLTGRNWQSAKCGIPQNKSSPCWQPYLTRVRNLSEDEQWRVLTHAKTLRVAIQREPLSRLISAFKNKLACDPARFNTTPSGIRMHVLRRQARLPPGPDCMNVSEYADALDRIRTHVGRPGYLRSMRQLDEHFRPQDFLANRISYDLVLDVADLSNFSRISPFLDRLPFAHAVRKAGLHCLDSGAAPLLMDDRTARKLHEFAALSSLVPRKYLNWACICLRVGWHLYVELMTTLKTHSQQCLFNFYLCLPWVITI